MSGSYVNMGDKAPVPGSSLPQPSSGLNDDPNLPQEERDLRLAISLQQQENAAAYEAHKRRQEANSVAKKNRTTRSSCSTGLASIRRAQKSSDESPVGYKAADGDYSAPGSADGKLAAELQKVEQSTVGTAQLMEKIVKQDQNDRKSNNLRSGRSAATRTG